VQEGLVLEIREGEQRIKDQEQNIKEKLPVKPN